ASSWPWPGYLCAWGGRRHERNASALGDRYRRRERCPGPPPGPDLDDRTVGDHVAGRVRGGAWPGRRRVVLGYRGQSTDRAAVAHPWRRVQRGPGRIVGRLPAGGIPGRAAGQHLRAGLLEANGAPRERPQVASVLRYADGRYGPAGDRPQQHLVPVRLGDHGA